MSDDVGAGDGGRSHRFRHDGEGSVTTSVVLALAELEGVDPIEMDPIYGAVDPDVLEALDDPTRSASADVTFDYHDYRVTVDGEGAIVITARAAFDPPGR